MEENFIGSQPEPQPGEARQPIHQYYHDKGRAHDLLLRCADCKKLVTYERLVNKGGCPRCGNRRVTEIRTLTVIEWLKIRLGFIRFEDRDLFLKEFKGRA